MCILTLFLRYLHIPKIFLYRFYWFVPNLPYFYSRKFIFPFNIFDRKHVNIVIVVILTFRILWALWVCNLSILDLMFAVTCNCNDIIQSLTVSLKVMVYIVAEHVEMTFMFDRTASWIVWFNITRFYLFGANHNSSSEAFAFAMHF